MLLSLRAGSERGACYCSARTRSGGGCGRGSFDKGSSGACADRADQRSRSVFAHFAKTPWSQCSTNPRPPGVNARVCFCFEPRRGGPELAVCLTRVLRRARSACFLRPNAGALYHPDFEQEEHLGGPPSSSGRACPYVPGCSGTFSPSSHDTALRCVPAAQVPARPVVEPGRGDAGDPTRAPGSPQSVASLHEDQVISRMVC